MNFGAEICIHLIIMVSLCSIKTCLFTFSQVHSDFVVAATRGAMAVIDGNIMAINPGEDAK